MIAPLVGMYAGLQNSSSYVDDARCPAGRHAGRARAHHRPTFSSELHLQIGREASAGVCAVAYLFWACESEGDAAFCTV
jgi:hypothetical protein